MDDAPNDSALLLEARDLGRRNRRDGGWLYRHLDLAISAGERLAVEGPSGSGKSLLLRSLALLDPTDEGELLWRGRPVSDRGVPAFRHRVIYLHQTPAFFESRVEGILRSPFTFREHGGRRFEPERIQRYLEALGWDRSFLDKEVRFLSGGEAQVAAFLRAVQLDPEVLLLDEPTASLDARATESMEALVDEWMKGGDRGRAYLWVTHDREQAGRLADRGLHIEDGRLT